MLQMSRKLLIAMVLVLSLAATARAEKLAVGLDTVWAERYIWRGIPLNEEYVLQPSLTVGAAGFALNVWGNVDLTDWGASKQVGYGDERGRPTEIDYTGSYTASLLDDKLLLGFGFVNYTFPHQHELGAPAITEVFGKAGLKVPLSPTLTAYWGTDQVEGSIYASLDLDHTFKLREQGNSGVGLKLAGHLGYADHKFIESCYRNHQGQPMNLDARFHDWSLQAALPLTLAKGVSLTPAYTYSAIMTDELRAAIDRSGRHKEAGIFTLTLSLSGELGAKKTTEEEKNERN
jgi:hypothetical protein